MLTVGWVCELAPVYAVGGWGRHPPVYACLGARGVNGAPVYAVWSRGRGGDTPVYAVWSRGRGGDTPVHACLRVLPLDGAPVYAVGRCFRCAPIYAA